MDSLRGVYAHPRYPTHHPSQPAQSSQTRRVFNDRPQTTVRFEIQTYSSQISPEYHLSRQRQAQIYAPKPYPAASIPYTDPQFNPQMYNPMDPQLNPRLRTVSHPQRPIQVAQQPLRPSHQFHIKARDSVSVTKERAERSRLKNFEFPSSQNAGNPRTARRPSPLTLHPDHARYVDPSGPPSHRLDFTPGSPPPRPSTSKHLAPLSSYDPFVRPRSDSLSSVVEDHDGGRPYTTMHPTRTVHAPPDTSGRLRRMATAEDLASGHRKAQMHGYRTHV